MLRPRLTNEFGDRSRKVLVDKARTIVARCPMTITNYEHSIGFLPSKRQCDGMSVLILLPRDCSESLECRFQRNKKSKIEQGLTVRVVSSLRQGSKLERDSMKAMFRKGNGRKESKSNNLITSMSVFSSSPTVVLHTDSLPVIRFSTSSGTK